MSRATSKRTMGAAIALIGQAIHYRDHDYRITARGVERRARKKAAPESLAAPWRVVTLHALLEYPADSQLWQWLRVHGAADRRPSPSGKGGTVAPEQRHRVEARWTLPRALVERVRERAESEGVPASHVVESAIERYLG